jgi:hypothetical protein
MQSSTRTPAVITAASALLLLAIAGASAQENYESWAIRKSPFESTGGGGIMIGVQPVIVGEVQDGLHGHRARRQVYYNKVEFDAVPAQGGTLCTNGNGGRPTAAPPARPRSGSS